MLTRLGMAVRTYVIRSPWTRVYGIARTLIALGTLGTLAASATTSLFTPAQGVPDAPYCSGVTRAALFCVIPADRLEWGRWVAIAILVVTASGWRPRWTALPHWWVTVSVSTTMTIPDGGDQIAANLALLILPIALSDPRVWHWAPPADGGLVDATRLGRSLIAWSAGLVIRLQVAGIYFQACVAKLSHDEWANGTALYYWLSDPLFGAPAWLQPVLHPVLMSSLGVLLLTWVPLVIEFALVLGLVARRPVRPYLLLSGILLHAGIGAMMGLWSFAFAMFGALVLYLWPLDETTAGLVVLTSRLRRSPSARPAADASPLPESSGALVRRSA